MGAGGRVAAGLDTLSSTDRGFVTWVAGMLREPIDELWARLLAGGTEVEGSRIRVLTLSVVGRSLRERLGPRTLQLPLGGLAAVELDVGGMDLDVLDVRQLPKLEVLRCPDNRIQTLDLSQSASLSTLDCAGNQLMVIDLTGAPGLRQLHCAGNGLAVLVIPGSSALEVVDVSRNQLMVLELPPLPALRELNAYRNALVRFALPEAPALVRLDLGRNELDALTLPTLGSLTWLSVARNKLDRLDLSVAPALSELKCHGNYLEALDLAACPNVLRVEARGNQVRTLRLADPTRLEDLDVSDNRLAAFTVAAPTLEVLRIGGNELTALSCRLLPNLVQLDVNENALSTLDLVGARNLAELRCAANLLEELDLRPVPHLVRLVSRDSRGRGPQIVADELQRQRIAELRTLFRLGTQATDPHEMDAHELHALALSLHGTRDGERSLMEIVAAPSCDLGTLLLVYWTSSPHYYSKYVDASEVPAFERPGWDLLAFIEARVSDGSVTRTIPFDPRLDRQTGVPRGIDHTRDSRLVKEPVRRPIAAALFEASGQA